MSDPTYSNPIWYRKYRIYLNRDFGQSFAFIHDDYEPEDYRAGYGNSIEECKEQIDDIEDD